MALDDEIQVLTRVVCHRMRVRTRIFVAVPQRRAHAAQPLEPLDVGALLVLRHHYRAHAAQPLGQLIHFTFNTKALEDAQAG